MAHVLEQDTPGQRHRFESIAPTSAAPCKRAVLPRSVWEPSKAHASMDFSSIVSAKQLPEWYSPVAERMTTPASDLAMLREAKAQHDLGL
eukprot:4778559-Alexandrium_andersonii.AAC.1